MTAAESESARYHTSPATTHASYEFEPRNVDAPFAHVGACDRPAASLNFETSGRCGCLMETTKHNHIDCRRPSQCLARIPQSCSDLGNQIESPVLVVCRRGDCGSGIQRPGRRQGAFQGGLQGRGGERTIDPKNNPRHMFPQLYVSMGLGDRGRKVPFIRSVALWLPL